MPDTNWTRETFSELTSAIQAIRLPDEDSCVLAVGSHGPTADCSNGFMSATIRVGHDEATGEAVHLIDALLIARGKVRDAVEARQRETEKRAAERGETPPTQ